ncbi:MAG: hypothetical protein U0P45_00580 [Acidimicrobiales bacterium]
MTDAIPMGGANEDLRALLFGNVPIDAWPVDDGGSSGEAWDEPWSLFVRARAHLRDGDQDLAIRAWSQIANPIFGWESRQVLQAWTFLRGQGIVPDASIAGEVLGVVVEIAMEGSHDVLAAYADRSVRFLHHLGGATVVEDQVPELEPHIAATLAAGQALAARSARGPSRPCRRCRRRPPGSPCSPARGRASARARWRR